MIFRPSITKLPLPRSAQDPHSACSKATLLPTLFKGKTMKPSPFTIPNPKGGDGGGDDGSSITSQMTSLWEVEGKK